MLVHELIELLLKQPQNMPVVVAGNGYEGGGNVRGVEALPAVKELQYRDIVNGRPGPWRPYTDPDDPGAEAEAYGHPGGCVVIRHGGE